MFCANAVKEKMEIMNNIPLNPPSKGEFLEIMDTMDKNHPALWAPPAFAGSETLLCKEGSLMDMIDIL